MNTNIYTSIVEINSVNDTQKPPSIPPLLQNRLPEVIKTRIPLLPTLLHPSRKFKRRQRISLILGINTTASFRLMQLLCIFWDRRRCKRKIRWYAWWGTQRRWLFDLGAFAFPLFALIGGTFPRGSGGVGWRSGCLCTGGS